MINVFEIAVNDQSIYYLGRIFGNVGTVLTGIGPGLLGAMFKVFNTGLLSLGALLVAYTTVVGVLKTASEGEFLGKWSSLWMPIRAVVGIAMLMPTKAGYCVIQIVMMWVIVQGVGAADSVWSTTIDYFAKGGTLTPPPAVGGFNALLGVGTSDKIKKLFQGITCQAAAKANYPTSPRSYYCSDPTHKDDQFCTRSDADMLNLNNGQQVSGNTYSMGPGGACGTLSWDNTSASNQPANSDAARKASVAKAQLQSYQAIVPTLGQVAKKFVDIEYQYNVQFKQNCPSTGFAVGPPVVPGWVQTYCNDNNILPCDCSTPKTSLPANDGSETKKLIGDIFWTYALYPYTGSNFLNDSINLYQGAVNNAVTSSSSAANDTREMFVKAKANGWILAGGYYYFIATMNNASAQLVSQEINIAPKDPSTRGSPLAGFEGVTGGYTDAGTIIDTIVSQQQKGGGAPAFGSAVGGDVFATPSVVGNAFMSGWMAVLTGSGDVNPIIPLQHFGEGILIGMQIAFAVLLVVIFATTGVAQTMSSMQGWGYALSTFYGYILTPIMAFFGALFIFGAMLAVYMPLIPYIIFTFAALGWLIATIETMVAAPLVALGLLYPEGHEIWGRAENAFMLILNIFIRPTLMIFGMMSGMLLSYVVIIMINSAFLGVVNQINRTPGLVEMFIFMAIYTSLIVTSLNKCFALIHIVPDKVLRWIGHGVEQFGEEQMLGEAKGASQTAAGGVTAAGKAGATAAGGAKAGMVTKAKGAAEGSNIQAPGSGGGGDKPPSAPQQ